MSIFETKTLCATRYFNYLKPLAHTTSLNMCWDKATKSNLNPICTGGGGGGGDAQADFQFRKLPCYLSNTDEMLLLLLKFIGEQDSEKVFCHGILLVTMQPEFRCHV